jgi:signal transduction histidine kinase
MEWFTMENPFVQKQNMTLARGAFRQQQLSIQTDAVVTWLNQLFPARNIRNSDAALLEALKDGSLLCELLAKIAPETGVKVTTSGKADFIRLENVGAYLRAVATIGVRNLFDAADLFEGRIFKVLSHILELAEVAKKRGFKPCVGDAPVEPVAATPRSAAASSSAAVAAAAPIPEADLELEETELDEENLQEYEKASEEMQARIEEAKKEAAQEAERKRIAAEEEARKLKEELEKMRIEKENLARELNQTKARKDEPAKLPFGNTETTQGTLPSALNMTVSLLCLTSLLLGKKKTKRR